MARRSKPQDTDLSLVESTNAVPFDGEPVSLEQPAENQSTGNVEYEAPGTTEVSHYTEDVVIHAETPGPVTVTFPGLPGVENKVIEPPAPETQPAPPEDDPTDPVPADNAPADNAPADNAPADPAPVDPAAE